MRNRYVMALVTCAAALSACDNHSNPAQLRSSTMSPTRSTGQASSDPAELAGYLNAVEQGNCTTAETFVHRPANGDLCFDGEHLGPLHFDQWRNPLGMPTPSCCIAYSVELHVTQDPGDDRLPRWVTRAFTLQHFSAGWRVTGVGTINGP